MPDHVVCGSGHLYMAEVAEAAAAEGAAVQRMRRTTERAPLRPQARS